MINTNNFILSAVLAVAITITSTGCNTSSTTSGTSAGNNIDVSSDTTQNVQPFPSNNMFYISEDLELHRNPNDYINPYTNLADMLEDALPSVVEVYSTSEEGYMRGSGIIFDIKDTNNNGVNDIAGIITCHHLLADANEITIKTMYGDEYEAFLIGSDPDSDIGVICIQSTDDENLADLKYAKWTADSNNLRVGMDVVAIGNPLGTLGGTVTDGIISSLDRDVNINGRSMTLTQTSCAINGGNSGGPLMTMNGEVVGVINAGYKSADAQGINFAISSNKSIEIASALVSTYGDTYGYIEGKIDLGASFEVGYYRATSGVFGVEYVTKYCIYVSNLDVYGSLSKAGVLKGDIIKKATLSDDESIDVSEIDNDSQERLMEFLSDTNLTKGDTLTLQILRPKVAGNYSDLTEYTIEVNVGQFIYGEDK